MKNSKLSIASSTGVKTPLFDDKSFTQEEKIELFNELLDKSLTKIKVRKYLYCIGEEREQAVCIIPEYKNGRFMIHIFDYERSERNNEKIYFESNFKQAAYDFAKRVSLQKNKISETREAVLIAYYQFRGTIWANRRRMLRRKTSEKYHIKAKEEA